MVKLSENSQKVLEARYLLKRAGKGNGETPTALFQRVATAVAQAENTWGGKVAVSFWEKRFFNLMKDLLFLPNSPTLMNAGLDHGQLSACFVLPLEDNLNSIFNTLKEAALIQKSGGGTGFNFSPIRPAQYYVDRIGHVAAGPVGFMKLFDAATEQIKQSGKRRGANMGILNISHPDIATFITAKERPGTLQNFNLSVAVPDAFMKALEAGEKWPLHYKDDEAPSDWVDAEALWDTIILQAWKRGDPGLLFLDTIQAHNPTPALGTITATNPCGEMPLLDYESCNLGSINLALMAKNKSIHWELLAETVADAIRFLDDVIDVNYFPLEASRTLVQGNRKIGLGVMGWAELLIKLEIPYASDRAVQLAEDLMRFIQTHSHHISQTLAVEKGPFPNWEQSIYYPQTPMRNATTTSIAPTGTISIIANTSSSIEPLYALAFKRHHVLNGEVLSELAPNILQYLARYAPDTQQWYKHILQYGTLKGLKNVPQHVQQLFLTANEIPHSYHLAHQAAFQKYTDNAVSKTVNLSHEATADQISEILTSAWKLGLKGITIYRDGSRATQVLKQMQEEIPRIALMQQNCRLCDLA